MYKEGDRILVRNSENSCWHERIFLHLDKNNMAICVYDNQDNKYKDGKLYELVLCKYHKPIPKNAIVPLMPWEILDILKKNPIIKYRDKYGEHYSKESGYYYNSHNNTFLFTGISDYMLVGAKDVEYYNGESYVQFTKNCIIYY